MEPNESDKKKINEDLVVFMRKRSDHEAPRYTARLKTYVDFQRKRRRAAAARRQSNGPVEGKAAPAKKIKAGDTEGADAQKKPDVRNAMSLADAAKCTPSGALQGDRPASEDGRISRRRGAAGNEEKGLRSRSFSHSRSDEPSDRRCRRRRRRRCGRRRRRRRSCRRRRRRRSRRRRRRRSCRRRRRRSCRRRRRRRSCSRRRRRRSCRRRRRRRRRC